MGFFDKLKNGLSKTKNSFDEKINNVFSNFRKVDEELLDEISGYDEIRDGAYNIRKNGAGIERKITENITVS